MYNRTFWLDHVIDGQGKVIQQGTNLSQDNFNKIELGVFEAGIEQDINAIMNNLNAREAAHAEPVLIANVSLVSGTNEVSIPVEKIRNTTTYFVQAMVTEGMPGTIVVTKRQANGFTVSATGTGKATFVVMGGIL